MITLRCTRKLLDRLQVPADAESARPADAALGDWYANLVRVESIGPNEEGFRGPVCLEGANRCPPEDVGGVHGYMELLHALRDAAHSRHRELME